MDLNNITFEGTASSLFDANISDIVEQMDMQDMEDLKSIMGFTSTPILSPNQLFTTDYGTTSLDSWTEGEVKQEKSFATGESKGFDIVGFANKATTTDLFTEWAKKSNTMKGANSEVVAGLYKAANEMKKLLQASKMTYTETMIKVWVDGFTGGTGTLTPKGLSLFNSSHVINATGGVQSNLIGTNDALTETSLQTALTNLKALLLDNGKRVPQPKGSAYKLFVSTIASVNARKILNTAGFIAGNLNGSTSNTNSSALNTFSFKGNLVEIVEMDCLGTLDKDGVVIGSNDYRFVTNPRYLSEAKAFKFMELTPVKVRTYMANDTDNEVAEIKLRFGVDHYGAELGIVGSKGTGS